MLLILSINTKSVYKGVLHVIDFIEIEISGFLAIGLECNVRYLVYCVK